MKKREAPRTTETTAQIAVWLTEGKRPAEIIALASERWAIGERRACQLIALARKAAGIPKIAKERPPTTEAAPSLDDDLHGIDTDLSAFEHLGPPPRDSALEGVSWMQKALVAAGGFLVRQRGLKPSQRRAELVKLSRAASGLVPKEEIAAALELMRKNAEGLDDSGPMTEGKHHPKEADAGNEREQPGPGDSPGKPGRRPTLRL